MSEVNVKIGTVVNGITIESHRAMQVKIADLAMENDELKKRIAELEELRARCSRCNGTELDEAIKECQQAFLAESAVPVWIAPGKWVENHYADGDTYHALISKVELDKIRYSKVNGKLSDSWDTLEQVKKGKPFTPPPCPQLPNGFDGKIHHPAIKFAGVTSSVHGWIAMMEASPDNWGNQEERLAVLIAYRDHIEKWG